MHASIIPPVMPLIDYNFGLVTTSTAAANGIDINSATATLSSGGYLLDKRTITFFLSGNARFTNGAQNITLQTNVLGEARVDFTNSVAETVTVTAQFEHLSTAQPSTFGPAGGQSNSRLVVNVIRDGAAANGSDQNRIRYTVTTATNQAIANELISFTATGNTALQNFGMTNNAGQYELTITSLNAQRILVTAHLFNSPTVITYTEIDFVSSPKEHEIIASVVSDNSTANGQMQNRLNYLVRNISTQLPVPFTFINVSTTNGASPASLQILTDNNGQASFSLTNQSTGLVSVTTILQVDPRVYNITDVNFN